MPFAWKLGTLEGGLPSDEPASVPLYSRIYKILRDGIGNGEYPPGSFLPSEQDIVTRFGVSRITAKRALDELAAAGYATRERGKGTRVNTVPRGTMVKGSLSSLIESQHANGRNEVAVLTFEYVPASQAIAEALELEPGDLVQRVVRVWRVENSPFSHLETHVPARIGDNWSRADMQRRPMVQLLEEAGIMIQRSEQSVRAILADEAVAPLLDVAPGSPLLRVERVNFDAFGVPVEHLVALYPEDRYTFRITLTG